MPMTAERHRITCPYCVVGAGVVIVERNGKKNLQFDTSSPIRCDTCHRYFLAKPKLQIVGVKLDEERASA